MPAPANNELSLDKREMEPFMNRRSFTCLAAINMTQLMLRRVSHSQGLGPARASIDVSGESKRVMPADFTGLSYEMPQLYNPIYFSPANTALVKAYRELSPAGVLRLGGNLSDATRWHGPNGDFATPKQSAAIEHGKTYWEWKLTDPSVRANKDGAITPEAIRNLRGFLDATNWKLIYGLNFGSGSAQRAADESRCVAQEIGSRLLCYQVGNESDFFGGNAYYRQKPFGFEDYYRGYQEFVSAVHARLPDAPFSGPDTANNLDWVDQLGKREKGLLLLTSHFYAMGPAKDPTMNAEFLLSHNDRLERQAEKVRQAIADAGGTRFRMTEGNSCYGGGKPDVSDAFASALWGADYMLACAQHGYSGVNLHGGGDGYYTPIAVGAEGTTEVRPLYFGMQFAQAFAGWALLACTVSPGANVSAYAARNGQQLQVALINKEPYAIEADLKGWPRASRPTRALLLAAPSLAAKTGIRFADIDTPQLPVVVAPYSALLLRWD
jgi:hypothetical protein